MYSQFGFLELFPQLSQNFSQLFDDADDYNVIIKVGENQNTKEFHAHSFILRSQSIYFERAFSPNWIKKKNGIINFTKPNISPNVSEIIIRYIYSEVLDLREKIGSDILELLVASDELLFEELVPLIQEYLIKNQTEWFQKNFDVVMQIAYQLENCEQLRDYCLSFIGENPKPFFNSPDFPTLEKSILLKLIKREDLRIEEAELWDYLIKWGIAQTTELKGKDTADLSSWNEKDFSALKNTLNQFISHIMFFEIPLNDFNNKIRPYKELLPEELFNDILSFHMINTEIIVDSKIIKPKHAAILANWIQRKEANANIQRNKKYNFNLIYRGSRDGYNINDTLCKKCHKHGPEFGQNNTSALSILVIKLKEENGTIIGGYNFKYWKYCCRFHSNPNWINTMESRIFSLGHSDDQNKISQVINGEHAIYEPHGMNRLNSALNFCNDLIIKDNSDICNKRNYKISILDINKLSIEEMEIFVFTIDTTKARHKKFFL